MPFCWRSSQPGIERGCLMSSAPASRVFTTGTTGEALASMEGALFEEDDRAVGSLENLLWAGVVGKSSEF